MHPAAFAIVGLLSVSGLLIYFVIAQFYAKRRIWSRFASQHGLHVEGLEPGGHPRIGGTYRGVSIEVALRTLGQIRIRRVGKVDVSDTWVTARFTSPLPAALFVTSNDESNSGRGSQTTAVTEATIDTECNNPEVRALFAKAEVTQVVQAFVHNTRYGYVNEAGVNASCDAMPKSVEILQKIVDDCVVCAQGIEASRTVA